ncbi:hypothetical protein [Shewanella sp. CG12_big_fil_rev_8_21_14_0_65_47_15]|uniref:hypothetical protein n=1 Tax=Shewanella sp. CG12_big_fil_rev_8_21_14_0_65_47_15 TaxID=1975537 RepID=UPI000CB2FA2F|nr:hypothetical protein [Shewanella sp. CG12_big_fil_rev_8_21_14_0_65_47_15]PIW59022.1 MAG: hypothetical protein COW15_19705 [Shewanella sp. CG12_big_fil_rev_8_21_14_0_65_47_15]
MAYINNTAILRSLSCASISLYYSMSAAASHLEVDDPALADRCELEMGWQQPRSDHARPQLNAATTCSRNQWEWHLGLVSNANNDIREEQAEVGIKLPLNLNSHSGSGSDSEQQDDWHSAVVINVQKNLEISNGFATEAFGIVGKTLGDSDVSLYANLGFTHGFTQSTQLLAGIAAAYELSSQHRLIAELYQKELSETAYQFAYQHTPQRQLQLELNLGNALRGNALQLGADITFYFGH